MTLSVTSWNASRSPVVTSTRYPAASACVTSVAMMSSASKLSTARNGVRETAKATATCVGASSRSRLISIAVKPYTAFVVCPVPVRKFSAGSAKNAR